MPEEAANPTAVSRVRRVIWVILVILGVLGVASVLIPVAGRKSKVGMRTLNMSQMRGFYPAIKMYAGDHDGRYPADLLEIHPDYMSGDADQVRYRDYNSQRRYDWFYVAGLTERSPSRWILVASPTEEINNDPGRRGRIILRNDGTAEVIDADTFNRAIADQRKSSVAEAR